MFLFRTHGSYWTEISANKHAKKYFEYYGVDWDRAYMGGEWRTAINEYGNQYRYWYSYTIEDWYPTY